jgi:predicted TIM-barrel fold metal-dependent hydrolase
VVLVQPSCYGTDNGALRHALSELGERARGVAVIGSLRPGELLELQAAGVRGVRLNLSVSGESDLAAAGQALLALQDAVGPMGWHIQMFASAPTIRALLPRLNQLEVGLVLDHYAGISLTEPDPGGEDAVMQLLARGSVYVKLSAPYRIGAAGRGRDAELAALTRRLAEAAPDRLLWASDWPHTGGAGRRGAGIDAIEPFRDEDAGDTLARLSHWLPDPAAWRRLLIDNPARLYGFSDAG